MILPLVALGGNYLDIRVFAFTGKLAGNNLDIRVFAVTKNLAGNNLDVRVLSNTLIVTNAKSVIYQVIYNGLGITTFILNIHLPYSCHQCRKYNAGSLITCLNSC